MTHIGSRGFESFTTGSGRFRRFRHFGAFGAFRAFSGLFGLLWFGLGSLEVVFGHKLRITAWIG